MSFILTKYYTGLNSTCISANIRAAATLDMLTEVCLCYFTNLAS